MKKLKFKVVRLEPTQSIGILGKAFRLGDIAEFTEAETQSEVFLRYAKYFKRFDESQNASVILEPPTKSRSSRKKVHDNKQTPTGLAAVGEQPIKEDENE